MPIFHLLFTSGILCTGMESSKLLRLFEALNIPNIKQRELSNIMKSYVIPAVYQVWQNEQKSKLDGIGGKSIIIASDMQVDSPGHSGLLGSGSTLDLDRNIVLDTQVIKVNKYTKTYISSDLQLGKLKENFLATQGFDSRLGLRNIFWVCESLSSQKVHQNIFNISQFIFTVCYIQYIFLGSLNRITYLQPMYTICVQSHILYNHTNL